jgi:transketolase
VADPRPSLIACRTIIGWGAPNKMGTSATHGAALGDEEIAAARKHLVWDSEPFDLPAEIFEAWRASGRRSRTAHEQWLERLAASPEREEFNRRLEGRLPSDIGLQAHLAQLLDKPHRIATRKASELALEAINAAVPETIGGSADLTGSNNTKTKSQKPLTKHDYSGATSITASVSSACRQP